MNKRFFWLKLKKDFFQLPEIKKLRKISGGDTFIVIYFKILLFSLENNGILIYEGLEDSFEEEMALKIDESIENVTVTISFLKKVKRLVTISERKFRLTFVKSLTGSESESAARVRKFRDKQRNQSALHCNSDVTQTKHISNKNVTPESESEKEKEKDIRSLPLTPSNEGEDEREIFSKIKNLKIFKNFKDNLLKNLISALGNQILELAVMVDKKERNKFDNEPKIKDLEAYFVKICQNEKNKNRGVKNEYK
ncbi:MAG: phage replisome organizer N-terminal domain-containing protein [bacterium]